MNIMAVDDEKIILDDFVRMLKELPQASQVVSFTDEDDALAYVIENDVDVAFLDVQMNGMGGLALAEKIQEVKPKINIIFLAGYMEYGYDAMKQHASGYLLKPPILEEIQKELAQLRNPIDRMITIKTFGGFDVYIGEEPVVFRHSRAKEVLANLVHHQGRTVTRKELAAEIYEDCEYDRLLQNRIQKALTYLQEELKENGLECIVAIGSNSYGVNPNAFACDYYDFLANKEEAINGYQGNYLENYSWAEYTNGWLAAQKDEGLH